MNTDYQYIVGHLQTALATDPRVNLLDIKVMVTHDRVHLTGDVLSEHKKQSVQEVVSELYPHLEIKNELTTLEVQHPREAEVICD